MSLVQDVGEQGETVGDRQYPAQNDETHSGKCKVSLLQKLLLSAQLLPFESTIVFEQMYAIPIMLMLGLPLSMSTMIGTVSGPVSFFLLHFIGKMIDRGRDPQRRKRGTVLLSSVLYLSGLGTVLIANVLHIMHALGEASQRHEDPKVMSPWNGTTTYALSVRNVTCCTSMGPGNSNRSTSSGCGVTVFPNASQHNATEFDSAPEDLVEVPFKAILSYIGFIVTDVAYDLSNAFVKSYMLSCCPQPEQTSLLVTGLLMGSFGGIFLTLVSKMNFSSMMGLRPVQGLDLVLQTSFLSVVIIILMAIGNTITVVAGVRLLKRTKQSEKKQQIYDMRRPSTCSDTNNQCNGKKNSDNTEQRLPVVEGPCENVEGSSVLPGEDASIASENAPLLSKRKDFLASQVDTFSISYRASDLSYKAYDIGKTSVEQKADTELSKSGSSSMPRKLKVKIALICISQFFCSTSLGVSTYPLSDFVGRAIYEGDPDAPIGSNELARYQDGVNLVSWGYLITYISYLAINTIRPRILNIIGHRVEFVVVHIIMVASVAFLALTARLEAYFIMTVLAATHRACYASCAYAVMNETVSSTAKTPEEARNRLGFSMALVASTLPLGYCCVFTFVGLIEQSTGAYSVPLWISVGCSALAAFFFSFVGTK